MRAAWQNRNLRRMGKYEPSPLKMLIRAFLRGNDLKAFLFPQSAFFAFPRLCHLKPTTATTTWNSKQMLDFAIFCLFRRSFLWKNNPLVIFFFEIAKGMDICMGGIRSFLEDWIATFPLKPYNLAQSCLPLFDRHPRFEAEGLPNYLACQRQFGWTG